MIARLQTTFLLFALLYGAACLVWWWPQQPLWAVLVALLPLLRMLLLQLRKPLTDLSSL